jgi:hypothetical protein
MAIHLALPEPRQSFLRKGAVDYLVKPSLLHGFEHIRTRLEELFPELIRVVRAPNRHGGIVTQSSSAAAVEPPISLLSRRPFTIENDPRFTQGRIGIGRRIIEDTKRRQTVFQFGLH